MNETTKKRKSKNSDGNNNLKSAMKKQKRKQDEQQFEQRPQKRVRIQADDENSIVQFHEMGLDDRILKAIAKLGWKEPTLIQEKAIPLALEGKDILARARTGSGKTGAFAIPLIQKVLEVKQRYNNPEAKILGLVITPSKELCRQIYRDITRLASSCSRSFTCLDISIQVDVSIQKPLLVTCPDVVIGTPARILAHLRAGNMCLSDSLQMLAIDEADLLFSGGHEEDMRAVKEYLPLICQTLLMSATLTEDVLNLKNLVLHNAVILKLQEPELPTDIQLKQYYMYTEEEDKFVLLYALFKLKLIKGKSLLFVRTVNRSYKLKLFLDQFGVKSCVLNGELPLASRCHIITQFNTGATDVVIACDEQLLRDVEQPNHHKSRIKKDKESGVARGIDFQFVSTVINFDFPNNINSYIHRVGRTARGNNKGYALSLVSIADKENFEDVKTGLQQMFIKDRVIKKFKFEMSEVEGFRYRARDVCRLVTKMAVKEARIKEIKQELLNSSKLKAYWEENPRDLEALKHDKALHSIKHTSHLKVIPDYILPTSLRKQTKNTNKSKKKKKKKQKIVDEDPLVSLEFKGF